MRSVFIVFLFLVVIWLGWGAPHFSPMPPNPDLPTFGQAVKDGDDIERAAMAGRLPEDQSLRAMRQRVTDAAYRLEAFPCDAAARGELRTALATLTKEQIRRALRGKDSESVQINGRKVDASSFLNEETSKIFEEALFQGVLRQQDLPFPRPIAAEMAQLSGVQKEGRFVCESGSPR